MGLQYGYDETKGKWYAKGFRFIRYYDTEEEMKADAHDATIEYFERQKAFHDIAMGLTQLRYVK